MATPADNFHAGRLAKGGARRQHFQKGIDEARAILQTNGNSPEGLFWLAVNMGAEALERGKMSALPVVPQMERLLLKLDTIDPNYEDAGASRVLGRLYHQAPAVISVGSSDKARKYLERALKLAPSHPGNQAFAADFLLEKGEDQRAKTLAAACLQALAASGGKYGDEAREWKKIAQDVVDD
ncbi:MAG: TRAP transporter TatT component family protein [Deltaproteobacteria bacterium]|nr:TRAP transporter TatT component family protein [Deltaproteobacteria bacterium]